jgi:hypothetical protein
VGGPQPSPQGFVDFTSKFPAGITVDCASVTAQGNGVYVTVRTTTGAFHESNCNNVNSFPNSCGNSYPIGIAPLSVQSPAFVRAPVAAGPGPAGATPINAAEGSGQSEARRSD